MDRRCPCCHRVIKAPSVGRPPVYCSPECRKALAALRRLETALDCVDWPEDRATRITALIEWRHMLDRAAPTPEPKPGWH